LIDLILEVFHFHCCICSEWNEAWFIPFRTVERTDGNSWSKSRKRCWIGRSGDDTIHRHSLMMATKSSPHLSHFLFKVPPPRWSEWLSVSCFCSHVLFRRPVAPAILTYSSNLQEVYLLPFFVPPLRHIFFRSHCDG
jgi:hypothetical protein